MATKDVIQARQKETREELRIVLMNEQWAEVAKCAKQMAELEAQLANLNQVEPKGGYYSFVSK
jgi:uncharacterized coiled-coil protein SlyX